METNETKCSLCIFCLKSTKELVYTSNRGQYRFFTLIVRHFLSNSALISADDQGWCKNACKVISEITLNGDDNGQFFESVRICRNCEETTRKFSVLYRQMQELEMRMDWEVEKLWNVMGDADKAVSLQKKNQLEKTSTNGGVVTLGEFRNTLKESCKFYLGVKKKKAVPNVHVKQIIGDKESPLKGKKDDVDFQISSGESSTAPPKTQPEVNIQPRILATEVEVLEHNDGQKLDEEFQNDPMVPNYESKLRQLPLPTLPAEPVLIFQQDEDPLNPSNNSQPNYICSTLSCSLPFTSKFELFQHNMANHIGKYFSSVQSNSLSSDQFNHCITQLLEATVDTFEIVDEKNYKCPFCSNLFPGRDKARNHLVVKHRPILKEKLVETQKSESFPPKVIETKISTTTTATVSTTLKRTRGWPKGKNRKLLNISRRTTTTNRRLIRKKHAHICNTCGSVFKQSSRFKQHQKVCHPETFVEKVNVLPLPSSSENKKFKTRANAGATTTVSPLTVDCSVCSVSLKNNFCLFQHSMHRHIEKYFLSVKLPSISDDQFKKIIILLLNNTVDNSKRIKSKYTCPFCSKLFCDRRATKNHLVKKHRTMLEEKLVELQNSGDADVVETHSNSKGNPIEEIKLQAGHINSGTGSPENLAGYQRRGQTFDCSLCSTHFKTKFNLLQHDMSYHIEKYFSVAKLEFMSDEQFKKCIVDTLDTCVGDFDQINSKYKCCFCAKQLSGRKTARYHLLAKHLTIIKDKLVEAQKSGSDLQQVESSMLSAEDVTLKQKRVWPKGKRRLKRRGRRRAKRVVDHVPVFRRKRVSKLLKCGGCGNKFVNEHTLRTHLKGYCKVLREKENGRNSDENSDKA